MFEILSINGRPMGGNLHTEDDARRCFNDWAWAGTLWKDGVLLESKPRHSPEVAANILASVEGLPLIETLKVFE